MYGWIRNKKVKSILNDRKMKSTIFFALLAVTASMGLAFCHKEHGIDPPPSDINTGTVFSIQGDQAGRPTVNIVLIDAASKDSFNVTQPSAMAAVYQSIIQAKLQSLNPGFTTNILGQSVSQLAGILAKDVLTVSTNAKTTYYDGTTVFTGRRLEEDVVDNNLLFIFGGPDGKDNPGLTSDHVDHNDKPFSTSFPYEAAPW